MKEGVAEADRDEQPERAKHIKIETRNLGPDSNVPLDQMRPFFFFTLVTGPRRSVSLKLSDTNVYEP